MINFIPDSWQYSSEMENLFFFFQCSEELLSFTSPDTFRLPVCNSMVLCLELRRIYKFLNESNQLTRYYSKYIPCIIDELIENIQQDFIIKKSLDQRLDSVITGLSLARTTPDELIKWINIIKQSCTVEHHKHQCEEEIKSHVLEGNSKRKLYWLIQNYYIDLNILGYSLEYLHKSVMLFFCNHNNPITNPNAIIRFLDSFTCIEKEYEFWVLADTYRLNNLSRIYPELEGTLNIQEIEEQQIIELKSAHKSIQKLYEKYQIKKSRADQNIKILSCTESGIDPFSAFYKVTKAFELPQYFEGYFKHKTKNKSIFDILLVNETDYTPLILRRIIPNRPFLEQAIIDKRIDTILNSECCNGSVFYSLFRAMDMHLDAINCKNEETMLNTFWTALEALFYTTDDSENKENVKFCILHIVQKTYMLKQLRLIFNQLICATDDHAPWTEIGINSFGEFVLSFMSVKAESQEFRKFTNCIPNNPLLRSRIFWLKKDIETPKRISQKIDDHYKKVSWHLDRIYRTRNLITHAGLSMPYIKEILFNVHNYFDYIINYIICKLENNSYIQSISSMVFEAKNDNQIHQSYLKSQEDLTKENYFYALFGPDRKIASFEFEVVIDKDNDNSDLTELEEN